MVDVIDPSITAKINPGGNMLTQLGQFAGIQNALNQNALFQQTFRARQAMGPLIQQATDPQTGETDWAKAGALVASHPETAFLAPEFLNNIAQKKLLDAHTLNAELEGYEKRMGIMSQITASALNNPDIKTGADLMPFARDVMAAGGIKDGNQKDMIGLLTQWAPLKGAELKQRMTQFAMANENGRKALSDINGTFDPAGGYDPATGQTMPAWVSKFQKTMTPLGTGAGATAAPTPGLNAPAPATGETPSFAPGTPSEAQKTVWTDVEKMRKGYNAQDERGQQIQILSAKLRDALARVHAGGGAEAYQEAGKFLQSLGIRNSTVDTVANGSLPSGQVVESLATTLGTMAVRQLFLQHGEDEGSAGRLTGMEWQKTVDTLARLGKDPRANEELLAFMDRQYTLRHAKAQTFNQIYTDYHSHKQLPGGMTNPTQFEPYWGDQLLKRGLMSGGEQ